MQQSLQFFLRHVQILINSQFIADGAQIFTQIAIIIQTADKIFHNPALLFIEIVLTDLSVKLIIRIVSRRQLHLALLGLVALSQQIIRNIVFRQVIGRLIINVWLIFSGLRLIIVRFRRFCHHILLIFIRSGLLQRGVIFQFVAHALLQIHHRKFQQARHRHLHSRELLGLLFLLCLYEFLRHINRLQVQI